jgi:hypothetical protein
MLLEKTKGFLHGILEFLKGESGLSPSDGHFPAPCFYFMSYICTCHVMLISLSCRYVIVVSIPEYRYFSSVFNPGIRSSKIQIFGKISPKLIKICR